MHANQGAGINLEDCDETHAPIITDLFNYPLGHLASFAHWQIDCRVKYGALCELSFTELPRFVPRRRSVLCNSITHFLIYSRVGLQED